MYASKWNDQEAQQYIDRYGPQSGIDVALRVYTSRLIGSDSTLVLHGGGNTSVKSTHKNIFGKEVEALFVKGSGWDLDSIEPPGLPGLDLCYLRTLRQLPALSDEHMVQELRSHLFDPGAPTPSVETLLHAFLPHKFIDHSHANAILALTNCRDAEAFLAECFQGEVLLVPYVMPGFALAKQCAEIFDATPKAKAMILLNHGLFTWGESARESYESHIEIVSKAHALIEGKTARKSTAHKSASNSEPIAQEILPLLRGCLALRSDHATVKRFVLAFRQSADIMNFVNAPVLRDLAASGPLTPDHVIRTKLIPLVLNLSGRETYATDIASAISDYEDAYREYFTRCVSARQVEKTRLDEKPRVILIPGVGLIGIGDTSAAATIAADIYEQTIHVKNRMREVSPYQGLPELDLFDVEYWSLEQAKLKRSKALPLHGQVAFVTGGCGAIGVGIARALKAHGAEVVIADIVDPSSVAQELGVTGIQLDVTDSQQVAKAFAKIVTTFGGVDIVVPNAGIAYCAKLETIDTETAQQVTQVNFLGYLYVIQEATRVMKAQNTGGNIVIISSKNVAAPGKEFAIYSATKAAGHQLGKVAALELAEYGIRVNMVTPDAVFGTDKHQSGLWQTVGPARAKARGISMDELQKFYQDRNLLKSEITADDVGRAVLFFATNQTPTTGATLPVDGGVPEAFPR